MTARSGDTRVQVLTGTMVGGVAAAVFGLAIIVGLWVVLPARARLSSGE